MTMLIFGLLTIILATEALLAFVVIISRGENKN